MSYTMRYSITAIQLIKNYSCDLLYGVFSFHPSLTRSNKICTVVILHSPVAYQKRCLSTAAL